MTAYVSTKDRVEKFVMSCFDHGYEPTADEVAMEFCDEDVSAGDYDGCSSELEMAYSEYVAVASRVLTGREA